MNAPISDQKPVSGTRAVVEALRLLHSVRLSPGRSEFLRGETVHIHIYPMWNDEGNTISVFVTCFSALSAGEGWKRLLLIAESAEKAHGANHFSFFDSRGQCVLEHLLPEEYSLTALETVLPSFESKEGKDVWPEREVFAPDVPELALAAGSEPIPGQIVLSEPYNRGSKDGRLRVELSPKGKGGLEIAFSTTRAELSQTHVRFILLNKKTARIEMEERIAMKSAGENWWRAAWQTESAPKFRFELMFRVEE